MFALVSLFAMLVASPQASVASLPSPGTKVTPPVAASLPTAHPSDNRTPAGTLRDGVLTLRLVAQWSAWTLHSKRARGLPMLAFAEEGKAPSIPGPVLRVMQGTRVHVSVRSAIPGLTLVVRGLDGHAGDARDSLVIATGATGETEFTAGAEGTFFYWGTISNATTPRYRYGYDGQLNGAFVVDPPSPAKARADRIFMITLWSDSSRADGTFSPAREFWSINGKSWPETERLSYTEGDSIRWRLINASGDVHPMHLHGFYYRVDAHGANGRDTLYSESDRRMAVTEKLTSGSTMQLVWSPNRTGGWVFHCHLTFHLQPFEHIAGQAEPTHDHGDGPEHHLENSMAGLMLAIEVRPARGSVASSPRVTQRTLRLVVNSDSTRADSGGRRFSAILQDGAHEPARDSMRAFSSPLVLHRGEPTTITVVNHSAEPTSIHWHGIELESYYDGVVGLGGMAGSRTPPIMPADSFVVHITPPRAGTFMYHTHYEDVRQQAGGLYGQITIVEPGTTVDGEHDFSFMLANNPVGAVMFNGSAAATREPLTLHVGQSYRLRIANITTGFPNLVMQIVRDSAVAVWRPVAKDGFDLPSSQAVRRPARQPISMGEIYDFEVTPDRAGEMVFEVHAGTGALFIRQPFRVAP
jgi:FtsP/CotA-like multicopper oxidase with cupredoxin domain